MNKCISADSHVTEPPGTYIDRIDPKFRDRAPRMHYDDTLGDVMLIDNGKSLVPFWLVAAAGRPTEEVRLDTGKRFEDLWRGGWDPVARLADQDTDGVVRRGDLPVGRHVALQLPRRRLPARVLRRVQPVDRRVLRDRARAPHRPRPDRAAHARGGHRRSRVDQGARVAGRDASGHAARRATTTTRCTTSSGTRSSISACRRRSTSSRARTTSRSPKVRGPKLNTFMTHPACEPGHHRLDDLRRGVRAPSASLRIVCVEADAGWAPHWMYRADHAYDRHRNWLTAGELSRPPERVVPRARVPDVPGRLGRVPHGRPHEHRSADVGERLPAQRRDVAAQPGDARRARAASRRAHAGRASCTTTSPSCTASASEAGSQRGLSGCHAWRPKRKCGTLTPKSTHPHRGFPTRTSGATVLGTN